MASQLPLPLHPLHQLPKFTGSECSREVDDFVREAKLALHLQPLDDRTAALWLIAALDDRARQEVVRLPVTEVDSPAKILTILEENWGEQRDVVTLATAFFNRQQDQHETIWEYGSHLQYLWRKVNQAGDGMLPATILRDTFTRGLQPPALRKDVRYFIRNHPATTFEEARKEAQRWMQDCSADGDILHMAGTATVASLQTQLEALTATVASLRQELQQPPPAQPPLQVRSCVAKAQCSRRRPRRRRRKMAATMKAEDKSQSFATVSSQNADKRHGSAAPRRQAASILPQLSPGELHKLQQKDPSIGPILSSWPSKPAADGNSELQALIQQHSRLVCRQGVLHRQMVDPKLGACEQLLLPRSLRPKVLSSVYNHKGHQGYQHAAEMLRPQVYWPGMYRDLEQHLGKCRPCIKVNQTASASMPSDRAPEPRPPQAAVASSRTDTLPSPGPPDWRRKLEPPDSKTGRQTFPQPKPRTVGHPAPSPVPSAACADPPTPAPRRTTCLAVKPVKRYVSDSRDDQEFLHKVTWSGVTRDSKYIPQD